mgnify:CR=1 FL=1
MSMSKMHTMIKMDKGLDGKLLIVGMIKHLDHPVPYMDPVIS